jgi:peroxiredoxin
VNFSDDRGKALDLIKQAEVKFPTVADTSGAIARKFGVVGMPTTVFVNAAGRVIARKHGFDPVMVDEVRRYFGVTPTDSS